jgi:hypothetical protein
MPDVMKTLFLNPPSFEGFDGGAGSRYQARREIRSFWYPTWLAQPAAMVPGSRLIDAPPDGLSVEQVAPLARVWQETINPLSSRRIRMVTMPEGGSSYPMRLIFAPDDGSVAPFAPGSLVY